MTEQEIDTLRRERDEAREKLESLRLGLRYWLEDPARNKVEAVAELVRERKELRAEVERLRGELEFAWKLPMAKKHRERLRAAIAAPQAHPPSQD